MVLFDALADLIGDDDGWIVLVFVALMLALLAAVATLILRGRQQVRRRATEDGAPPAQAGQSGRALEVLMARVGRGLMPGDERQNRVLRLRLTQAGFFGQDAILQYFAGRLAAMAGLGLATGVFFLLFGDETQTSAGPWLYGGLAAALGYFLPSLWLDRRIARRVQQNRMGFPDFMDLMVVCAEAGLTMEAAIERIAREFVEGYPCLAENLYIVALEVRAGTPMPEALERFGQRLGLEEAGTFATLLQQSAELGTSLSQSLRVYSDEMRHKRMSRAEEKAYALPAKLVVPLTVFVFPVLIITIMYPAAVRVMSSLSNT